MKTTAEQQGLEAGLEGGAYELIQERMERAGAELRDRLGRLNARRQEVFGAVEPALLATERVTTANNCTPRDMVVLGGNRFLFGYNVHVGLRSQTDPGDVFALYEYRAEDHSFHELSLDLVFGPEFAQDFRHLYRYYKETVFAKFRQAGPHLYMAFQTGKQVTDIKTFKWLAGRDDLTYLGNRFDHEYVFPPAQEFVWKRARREMYRFGDHPHVSIDDRVFVETVGGDLTIKVEDNTASGEGIYAEPVADRDQTLDDAEIHYAVVGSLILLKILPFREKEYRYLVYNEKVGRVTAVPGIRDACVLLPAEQGLIFANGYLLQTGGMKQFENGLQEMIFERRIASVNGEDTLYVFYNRQSGEYVLLSYNQITQAVATPVPCHGFSIFPSGEMVYFRREEEPQRHHVLQIWRTPYVSEEVAAGRAQERQSYLYRVGNAEIVRCLSECGEILALLGKDDSYAGLYLDLVKRATAVADSYFWLGDEEAMDLREPLKRIREAADAALGEYDKVVRLRKAATTALEEAAVQAREVVSGARRVRAEDVPGFVRQLAALRRARGNVMALRDIRYVDVGRVAELEGELEAAAGEVGTHCVEHLSRGESLDPYRDRVSKQEEALEGASKVVEIEAIERDLGPAGEELDLLLETMSNLRIEDGTQVTAIMEGVSGVYAYVNQVRARLRNKRQSLAREEGAAQFHARVKLLNQAAFSYVELCVTLEKCDEFLTKCMIQVEELEGQFGEFEDFQEILTERRDELRNVFEAKKLSLTEARGRRAASLMRSAQRILDGMRHRVGQMQTVEEIHGYLAGDLMSAKAREIVGELNALGESVKAGDVETRLKTIREEGIRQLKDKKELFTDGGRIIQLGEHRFAVNTQELELTLVPREGRPCLHLSGTGYFEAVEDAEYLELEDVWDREVESENREVYRAEYLAYQFWKAHPDRAPEEVSEEEVRQFMTGRYREGYTKGVHDHDALEILRPVLELGPRLGLLRYGPAARALALVFWETWGEGEEKAVMRARLRAHGEMREVFGPEAAVKTGVRELEERVRQFADGLAERGGAEAVEAANYLAEQLRHEGEFVLSRGAGELIRRFQSGLAAKRGTKAFEGVNEALREAPLARYRVILDWIRGYASSESAGLVEEGLAEEAAAHLLRSEVRRLDPSAVDPAREIAGLRGAHRVIGEGGRYLFHYNRFMEKLARFAREDAPRYRAMIRVKTDLVERRRKELRLEEYKARVMTSFVRNRLIDRVYLPVIGANLAKQLGTAGGEGRTDRMGMLLLISPPGYGKTTLMEYVASRLGITFVKINGPALGHRVTSLDPGEAPNASAREEVDKLNLALEMGDNVMIYVDDIQHCHAEFLQKFISLCDAQRKMEGVWKGQARTYDLRGKKVAVVMAGNPYTESGTKFQVPDMLANRADTYNLGDILGGQEEAFKASYLENALTSNPVLAKLAARSQQDVHAVLRLVETGSAEGVEFEGNYTPEEITELTEVMRKLCRVRDTILRVNQGYIASASQAEEFRTEPPFRLQGSYRNMNRIAERVLPMMTSEEIDRLILDHYESESQNLTTGAEANLLKFKEMEGWLSEAGAARWESIGETFRRNLRMGGAADGDPVSRVVGQLALFEERLEQIREVLREGVAAGRSRARPRRGVDGGS